MFLDAIKHFVLKKRFENKLDQPLALQYNGQISKVAVLLNETSAPYFDQLLQSLIKNGILATDVHFLIYKSKKDRKAPLPPTFFGNWEMNWQGAWLPGHFLSWAKPNYDLLINFFEEGAPLLCLASHDTKAGLKVGLSSTDHRLNHLMIGTSIQKPETFVKELFTYLPLLKIQS
ncbi:MAG: hypothetical protein CFE24_06370 [Flavobacterium sp. BFFFF2]|nr:MAG: hypothetical protein CFE24_06370 [Flavobacterium sp. BFFFF2]